MLVNVPLRNQLNEPTTDGGPDEAADANCVPASLGAAVSALSGQTIYGDALRDLVYPESYTGATNPADYAAVLASHFGITMTQFESADGNALIQRTIAALEQHQPVSAAIPSEWGLDYSGQDMVTFAGGTHEITFCDWDGVNLTAMNPWPEPPTNDAFYQTQPAAWWAARLVYGRIFTLSGGHPMSNVVPVWNATAGTLAYPAHDGIPAIQLDHGQAFYAQQNRQGRYPLAPAFYDSNGDSIVGWNDGMDSRADKDGTPAWVVTLEDSGPRIAAALAEAATVPSLSQQIAALQQQIATGGSPAGEAALAEVAAIKKVLGIAA